MSDSTDSFRVPMDTKPEEITRVRVDRLERKVAVQGERIDGVHQKVDRLSVSVDAGFAKLGDKIDAANAARSQADLEQAVAQVRSEERQKALEAEVKAQGKKSGAVWGAATGGGLAALGELIRQLIDLFAHRGGH